MHKISVLNRLSTGWYWIFLWKLSVSWNIIIIIQMWYFILIYRQWWRWIIRWFPLRPLNECVYWYDSAIKPRICKVLEKNFWGGSIIKWVILYPKHRTSGCHVIGSRDNHVSKFEVPKNVGSFFWYLHWIFPDFLSIDDFSIV